MPRKKRDLRRELERAGFRNRGGTGDYTVYTHPLVPGHVSPDGRDGDDAKRYDEKNLRRALDDLERAKSQQRGD